MQSNWDDFDETIYKALIDDGYTEEEANRVIEDGEYFTIEGHSETDVGYYLADEGYLGDIPEQIAMYIDYESLGRDYCINHAPIYFNGMYIFTF